MKTKALVYQSWDDLVFENRNKEYGAYSLRKTYPEKLFTGLLVSLTLIGMLFFLPSGSMKKVEPKIFDKGIIELSDPPVWDLPQRTAPPKPLQQVTHRNDLPPQVVSTPVEPTPVDEPAEPSVNSEGIEGNANGTVSSSGGNTGTVETFAQVTPNETVFNPEVIPSYEGGYAGMMKYFQKNLKYPASARRMGVEGTVFVSFIVNGDGSLSDVVVTRGFHPDCDKEAVRVVSKMPGWTGGKHGGYPVRVRMALPIKFALR